MKFFAVLFSAMVIVAASTAHAALPARISGLLGKNDSLLVTDESGNEILAHNADTPRVPASTLKVLTCLTALETLGPDYRFPTGFYARGTDTLVVKGYGDPLFISEVMQNVACEVGKKDGGNRPNLVLDDSYFGRGLEVPGAVVSAKPYDSPVGALCANFNSVFFHYSKGVPESDEPQTPLVPFAENLIMTRRLPPGRVLLADERGEATLYAGNLFAWFCMKCGGSAFKTVSVGTSAPSDRLIYTALSPFTLKDMVGKLLATSSNFMTNQIFLATGAKVYGAPATFEKGAMVVRGFAKKNLGIPDLKLVEGSGLSRENRITARQMDKVLVRFFPFRELMKEKDGIRFKTGTLTGVSSRVGYVGVRDRIDAPEKFFRVVIFCNSQGKSAQPIIEQVARWLRDRGPSQDRS